MTQSSFDLTGKVALVTGGNGGIGLGFARGLARAGADVVIWGRDLKKNDAAEQELLQYGTKILSQQIDITSETAVVDGFSGALASMGRMDFVVANAGGALTYPLSELTTPEWRRVITTNLDSVFWLFKEACKHMTERAAAGDRGGSLAAVASVAAVNPPERAQAYASAKAGVIALTRSIAVEHGHLGIRANAILPGFVRTNLSEHLQQLDAFTRKVINGRVPVKRWGDPDDFAGIAVYLASDLSKFHTADQITIDGGYTAG